LQDIEEEIRQRIMREKDVEAERAARDKELEVESVKLDQELEQEIRGASLCFLQNKG
jgi:dynein intermediate chain